MLKTNQRFGKFILIAFSLLFAFNGISILNTENVNAEMFNKSNIVPYYTDIQNCSVTFSISGIKANCKAKLIVEKSTKLKIKMELQKEKSNGYETVETWSDSKTGTYLSMSESRNINVLSNYRLKVTFTAGNETETIYKY